MVTRHNLCADSHGGYDSPWKRAHLHPFLLHPPPPLPLNQSGFGLVLEKDLGGLR